MILTPDKLKAHEKLIADARKKEATEEKKKKSAEAKQQKKKNTDDFLLLASSKSKAFSKLNYRRLDNVQSKPINWLWPGRIACGKVTLFAGDPGLGKSQITASLAGIVTTGGKWPVDGAKSPQGAVIFLSAEDDAADTIRPRLEAAGAELSRCIVIDSIIDTDETGTIRERSFSVKNDLKQLENIMCEVVDVRLIIIDPITAYMGGVDSHKAADVREFMSPLAMFAEKHRVAILGISHLNKSSTQDALQRVNGSLAMVAAARAAFIAVKDKNNPARRLLLPIKNNIAKDIGGFAFSIADTTLNNGIETSKIVWEDAPVNMTADEAMNARPVREDTGAIDEARSFLLDLLADGPMPSGEVKKEAEKAGFSWASIRRAKDIEGIKSERESPNGRWFWSLNPHAQFPHAQTLCITNEHVGRDHINQSLEGDETAPHAQFSHIEHVGKKEVEKLAAEGVL